jgi:N-acetylneuraminic acid mutarotase
VKLALLALALTAVAGGDSWASLQPAQLARTEVTAARIGHVIYVFGGFEEKTKSSTVALEGYDVATGRWRVLRSAPLALNHAGMAAYRGSLYVLGGYAATGDSLSGAVRTLFRYDPARNRWSRLPSAPTARAAFAVGVVGNRLYAAGGRNDRATLSSTEIFDFRTRRGHVARRFM